MIEVCPNRYVAEASSLGLKPGEWPSVISTRDNLFLCEKFERCQGELIAVRYVAEYGDVVLTIYND